MVRYSHIGVVTAQAVTVTSGEYASATSTTSSIEGRLELTQPSRIKSSTGDWVDIKAKFFTKVKKITNANTLTVNSVVYKIVSWIDYQTSSEIWLD